MEVNLNTKTGKVTYKDGDMKELPVAYFLLDLVESSITRFQEEPQTTTFGDFVELFNQS